MNSIELRQHSPLGALFYFQNPLVDNTTPTITKYHHPTERLSDQLWSNSSRHHSEENSASLGLMCLSVTPVARTKQGYWSSRERISLSYQTFSLNHLSINGYTRNVLSSSTWCWCKSGACVWFLIPPEWMTFIWPVVTNNDFGFFACGRCSGDFCFADEPFFFVLSGTLKNTLLQKNDKHKMSLKQD